MTQAEHLPEEKGIIFGGMENNITTASPRPVKKATVGVTFKIDEEEGQRPKHHSSPLKRHAVPEKPEKREIFNAKTVLIGLIALKMAVHIFVLLCEISKLVSMREPDLLNFPLIDESIWSRLRSNLIRHNSIKMCRAVLEDLLLMAFLWKDAIFKLWSWHETALFSGKNTSRWTDFLRAFVFVQTIGALWLLRSYVFGAFSALCHVGMSYKANHWPHQSSIGLHIATYELFSVGTLFSWELLGDLRFFSVAATISTFFLHALAIFVEPSKWVLRLKYGEAIETVHPESHLHDILVSLSRLCSYPLSNFFYLTNTRTHVIRSSGYKTASAIVIDSGLPGLLEALAPAVQVAFPETSGPDDSDQMMLGALAHDIGHAMTGQVLWYNAIGYGLFYSGLCWFLFESVMKRPIWFRSFGFRLRPVPPACALLISAIAFCTLWQTVLLPVSNLVQWMCEFEADSYAASLGFGPSLHKFVYVMQAGTSSLSRAYSTINALFSHRHPPYSARIKFLQ